jgi:hypothetical protein
MHTLKELSAIRGASFRRQFVRLCGILWGRPRSSGFSLSSVICAALGEKPPAYHDQARRALPSESMSQGPEAGQYVRTPGRGTVSPGGTRGRIESDRRVSPVHPVSGRHEVPSPAWRASAL